jgi:hypothetical protein
VAVISLPRLEDESPEMLLCPTPLHPARLQVHLPVLEINALAPYGVFNDNMLSLKIMLARDAAQREGRAYHGESFRILYQ